jgi:hypothetical protein
MDENSFIRLGQGHNVVRLFLSLIYDFLYKLVFIRLGCKSLPRTNAPSSLLSILVNYGQNSFMTLAPGRVWKHIFLF